MSRRRTLTVVGVAGALVALVVLGARTTPARRTRTAGEWPKNFAHRGDSTRAPENTLEAFRAAVEEGAGGLELDVRVTRDGHVVVLHDATVDRTTDGAGVVAGMTLPELRRLDAGYRFSPDGGRNYPFRGQGVRVPTLAEVLEEFPGARVNADIKQRRPRAEEAVARVLREAGAEGRVLVASEYPAVLARFREVSGGRVSTGASRREVGVFLLLNRLRLERFLRPAYDALQVPVRHSGIQVVTPRFVEAAHRRGVRVDAWVIDDPGEMRRLLGLGVDVVMTKLPAELARVLEDRASG